MKTELEILCLQVVLTFYILNTAYSMLGVDVYVLSEIVLDRVSWWLCCYIYLPTTKYYSIELVKR